MTGSPGAVTRPGGSTSVVTLQELNEVTHAGIMATPTPGSRLTSRDIHASAAQVPTSERQCAGNVVAAV